MKAKTKTNKMINKMTKMTKNKILMNRINKIIKRNKKTNNSLPNPRRKIVKRRVNINNNKSKKK